MPVYGLIGFPLAQSSSKPFFERKFEQEQMTDARFSLFRLKHIDEFPSVLAENPDLKGLAVTIPHKTAVMQYLDELDETAAHIGAVNCIRVSGGKLIGYNTDTTGFQISLNNFLNGVHPSALVLGTGGASKAVRFALKKLEIDFKIVSRSPDLKNGQLSYDALDQKILNAHKLIINCTPVGMTGYLDGAPELPYHLISSEHFLYDLIYKPPVTGFMIKGEKQSATVKNGEEMFLLQAEENWRIWNLPD